MQSEIKLWTVELDKLIPIHSVKFGEQHREEKLESWIAENPDVLGVKLLVVGRQVTLRGAGEIDLLCVNAQGKLVIVEFKRGQTSRDTIAQILDYCSALDGIELEQLFSLTNMKKREEFAQELEDFSDLSTENIITGDPEMLLVAPDADETAERIVEYLGRKSSLNISLISFTYAIRNGQEFIARTVSVSPKERLAEKIKLTDTDLSGVAEQQSNSDLFETVRQFKTRGSVEQLLNTNGGSVRYWIKIGTKNKVLFGANIGGQKLNSPKGSLDVWIRKETAGGLSGESLEAIRQQASSFNIQKETKGRMFLRLTTIEEAEHFLRMLYVWDDKRLANPDPPAASDGDLDE